MTFSAFLFQALNGLSTASGLFFIAAGLSLIFGVTRIVNIAHGSLYMLGTYIAYSFATKISGALGFWGGIIATALVVGAIGALIEVVLLRRIYRAPELFQLLATFALALVINDAALWLWGPEDLLGPRAPGLRGAIEVLGRQLPSYDLFLIFIGPLVLLLLHFTLARTRFGRLVRAATQDREMVGALGVNQAMLFTAVFALGAALAGLGGASGPREPANLATDLVAISDAFVVVVVGGMGSMHWRISRRRHHRPKSKRICIGIGVVDFGFVDRQFFQADAGCRIPGDGGGADRAAAMACSGRQQCARCGSDVPSRSDRSARPTRRRLTARRICGARCAAARACRCWRQPVRANHLVLGIDVLIARAVHREPALHHGAGRHGVVRSRRLFRPRRLCLRRSRSSMGEPRLDGRWGSASASPVLAGLGGVLFGWFTVRLSGVYLAMLTLAFAQIVWSVVFQWDYYRRRQRRTAWAAAAWDRAWVYSYYADAAVDGHAAAAAIHTRAVRLCHARGPRYRAARRGDRHRREARAMAGFAIAAQSPAWPAGCSPSQGLVLAEPSAIGRSIDGLVRVLLGGVQTVTGPIVGAPSPPHRPRRSSCRAPPRKGARCSVRSSSPLVLAFPEGLAGFAQRWWERRRYGAERGGGMSVLAGRRPAEILRRRAGRRGRELRDRRRRAAGADRPQRGRQDHLLQHAWTASSRPTPGGALRGPRLTGLKPRAMWRLGVGRTFQITATFGSMTVVENVQMALLSHVGRTCRSWRPRGRSPPRTTRSSCGTRWAWAARRAGCGVLAYGDVKRVEPAIAMAHEPRLMLMDEPTAGMAPGNARPDGAAHAAGGERGIAVLFTEHTWTSCSPCRPHHRAGARPPDRRGRRRRDARQRAGARGLFRHRQNVRGGRP